MHARAIHVLAQVEQYKRVGQTLPAPLQVTPIVLYCIVSSFITWFVINKYTLQYNTIVIILVAVDLFDDIRVVVVVVIVLVVVQCRWKIIKVYVALQHSQC